MDQFPANSAKAKAEQRREPLRKVTSAEPVRRRRGLGRQFKDTFIGGDSRSASEYVFFDVIIPAVRETLYEAFTEGIRRLIFGDSARRRPTGGMMTSSVGHYDYRGVSSRTATSVPQTVSRAARARNNFNDLVIPTRGDADEVLDQMFTILEKHGEVSVADLYEMTGIQSSHTDMKWGWRDLQGSKVVPTRQGAYLLDLPRPEAFI